MTLTFSKKFPNEGSDEMCGFSSIEDQCQKSRALDGKG